MHSSILSSQLNVSLEETVALAVNLKPFQHVLKIAYAREGALHELAEDEQCEVVEVVKLIGTPTLQKRVMACIRDRKCAQLFPGPFDLPVSDAELHFQADDATKEMGVIKCHKGILAARCKYFETALMMRWNQVKLDSTMAVFLLFF